MLCPPKESAVLSVAVPLRVSHTFPRTALSSQNVAVSISQNVTNPAVSGVPLDVTVAVKVNTVPAGTDVAGAIVSCVAVGAPAKANGATNNAIRKTMNARKGRRGHTHCWVRFTLTLRYDGSWKGEAYTCLRAVRRYAL